MNTVSITCAREGCGYSPFPMEKGFNERARKTHETFYCPAGHANYFAGMSREEWLERELKWAKNRAGNLQAAFDREYRESRTCPWPTCREYVYSDRYGMYAHMRRTHGMPLLAAVSEAS